MLVLSAEKQTKLLAQFQALVDVGCTLHKRTRGYNGDFESLTPEEAVDELDCCLYADLEEVEAFLAGGYKKHDLEYHYNSSAWTCGDGCCSESDYFFLVVQNSLGE